ncbi:MAG: hypothetical protein K2G48_01745, partial [Malacoplasma sp.]|nr:hypothetical protein [Malacoplasma sp.]
ITLTTYAGLLLWSHKLTDNNLLKQYYSSVKSVNDISTYKVINFAYLESKNILFVLFGQETTTDSTTTLSNLTVFGLDINSGAIVVPKNATLSNDQVIAKARDNSAFIFFNSSDQLIVTSGYTNANIVLSTKIMSFDDNNGFSNVKGNDAETNDFNTITGVADESRDYLLGFLPSGVKGINFSIWLFYNANNNGYARTQLTYKSSNAATNAPDVSINKTGGVTTYSFNYYVFPVDDDFVSITPSNDSVRFEIANKLNNVTYRGYLNSTSQMPDFNSIYKRFFITSNSTTGTTVKESVGVLLDSYDKMFASFSVVPYVLDATNSSYTYEKDASNRNKTATYMNMANNTITGPNQADSLNYDAVKKTGLEDNLVVNNWEFSSVGYDKESDFVYFSLSGEEYSYSGNPGEATGKYLTNTRYIDLKPETDIDKRVSADAYIQDSPYTLSDVNFDTYTDTNNLYLAKQAINGSDGQWLS